MRTTSAIKLADAQAAGLAQKRKVLGELDAYILELTEAADAALADWLRENPSKSPDATSEVAKLRRKVADAVGRRDRLAAEVSSQQQILESLTDQADAERAENERREQAATIAAVEAELGEAWREFVGTAEKLREQWPAIVSLASTLDGLPAGSAPISPFPSSLAEGVKRALTVVGNEPFASDPRIVAKRIPTAGSSAATDTRGFATSLRQLGDY